MKIMMVTVSCPFPLIVVYFEREPDATEVSSLPVFEDCDQPEEDEVPEKFAEGIVPMREDSDPKEDALMPEDADGEVENIWERSEEVIEGFSDEPPPKREESLPPPKISAITAMTMRISPPLPPLARVPFSAGRGPPEVPGRF